MKDFIYYTPTKMIFGKGKHREVGKIIRGYGYGSIMLMYGQNSIKRSGLYDEIMESLRAEGIRVIEAGGVEPNPKLDFVRKSIETARQEQVEMILAVGGGSVIDSAKATAAGVVNTCDVWDLFTKKAESTGALPVGAVPTMAAAGSEMSASAVITNLEENMKRGYNSDFNRCLFAICNPELTMSLGPYQTACGIVDIMSHTMERYFGVCPDTELTDQIAEGLLCSVIRAGSRVMADPRDYEARAEIMWASNLSHNDLTGCGREFATVVHQLEHAVSGEYDEVAHGAGLAVMYPAWARYMYPHALQRFARFARNVWGVTEADDVAASLLGIEAMEDYFRFLGMPL